MKNLINEIRKNLENKNYIAALALALILPDICGEIAYPKMDKNSDKYKKWYDNYVYEFEVPEGRDRKYSMALDGQIVYKLRCNLFHEGSMDVEKEIREYFNLLENSKLKIVFTNRLTSYSKAQEECNKGKLTHILIRIGIEDFCNKLCWVSEEFYSNSKMKKSIFNNVVEFDFV